MGGWGRIAMGEDNDGGGRIAMGGRGRILTVPYFCVNRLEWLIGGSRALFGTICEQRIGLILDTSSSMAGHLDFVKSKVKKLIQVQ